MIRIGIAGMFHETNSFAAEENDELTAIVLLGEDIITHAHPRNFMGGFLEAARRPDVSFSQPPMSAFSTAAGPSTLKFLSITAT